MPYEIKEKKGKKAKKFSVVNKETGKVMSKGTTEKKAKKQIKAIYANMRPEHRIRYRIGLMEGASIKDPVHRAIIKDVRKLLKKEEIHGSGIFSDWFVKNFPVLAMVILGTKPEDVGNAVKDYGLEAVGALLEPWTFPFAVASAMYYTKKDPSSTPNAYQESMYPDEVYDYDDGEIDFANIQTANDYDDDDLFYEEEEDIYEEVAEDIEMENETQREIQNEIAELKKDETKSNSTAEKIDKLVEKIMEDEGIDDKGLDKEQRHGLDDSLRFPMIYNYDENTKPMYLQEWLLSSGVAGRNFAVEEFGNTVRNQEPYAFLNFPINGGRLGKINYSKLGYSKY
jgi:hypothetical protein